MQYKEINLISKSVSDVLNEIKFEIATARAEEVELLIVKYLGNDGFSRFLSKVTPALRRMKQKRLVQLYAAPDNFERGGTESVYLKNKYPELFQDILSMKDEMILYIKL